MRAPSDGDADDSRPLAPTKPLTSDGSIDCDVDEAACGRDRIDADGDRADVGEPPITVGVVDDLDVVRAGLVQLLRASAGLSVVGSARNGVDAIALIDRTLPHVVVIDASTRIGGGVDVIRTIKRRHPSCKVVVLTASTELGRIRDARAAGADGFVSKRAGGDEVVGAIRSVIVDGHAPDAVAAPCEPTTSFVDELTARQLDVLALLGLGRTNKQIAAELGIGDRTLKADLAQIYRRLGVTTRTQAAIWAVRHTPQD